MTIELLQLSEKHNNHVAARREVYFLLKCIGTVSLSLMIFRCVIRYLRILDYLKQKGKLPRVKTDKEIFKANSTNNYMLNKY